MTDIDRISRLRNIYNTLMTVHNRTGKVQSAFEIATTTAASTSNVDVFNAISSADLAADDAHRFDMLAQLTDADFDELIESADQLIEVSDILQRLLLDYSRH